MTRPARESFWLKPARARANHYFVDDRSLCGRWYYEGVERENEELAFSPDCQVCLSKRTAARARYEAASKED